MRAHNFGAGPCTLPLEVLEEVQAEFVDFAGSGMSLFEMSHRSKPYDEVHQATLAVTRRVSGAPDDFEILFIQGGATLQFAMVPMNLLGPDDAAGVVISGSWGKKAYSEGGKHGNLMVAWDGSEAGFATMPGPTDIDVDSSWRYLHITTNETIGGVRMLDLPETDVRLVGDMSSDYLARPIDWDRYDLVYGGVQKNLAPAGMAVVFVRRSAITGAPNDLASYLDYGFHADSSSLGNTPPMFSIYVMGKVLARMEASGGIAALERESAAKAEVVYSAIDESNGFFDCPVDLAFRSHMNVVFRLPSDESQADFLAGAAERNMIGLKGHRSVGGCRASLYAALPMGSAEALAEYMREFSLRP